MPKLLSTGLRWLWIAFLIFMIDYATKLWVVNHLVLTEPLVILPIFNLTLAYNTGAAFSFLHAASGWQTSLLLTIALVISFIILIWLSKLPKRDYWIAIALNLILGGALGNAWDRVTYKYVIDFFDFHLNDWHFAIFNVADSAITIGAIMLLGYWLFAKEETK